MESDAAVNPSCEADILVRERHKIKAVYDKYHSDKCY